jgi:hypothetical protein
MNSPVKEIRSEAQKKNILKIKLSHSINDLLTTYPLPWYAYHYTYIFIFLTNFCLSNLWFSCKTQASRTWHLRIAIIVMDVKVIDYNRPITSNRVLTSN